MGLVPVTFLTVLPLTQLIVFFAVVVAGAIVVAVVAVVDEPPADACVSFTDKI